MDILGSLPDISTMNSNKHTIIGIVSDHTLTIQFNSSVNSVYGDRRTLLKASMGIFKVLAKKNPHMQFILICPDDNSKRFYNYNNTPDEKRSYYKFKDGRIEDVHIKDKDKKKYKLKFIPDELVTCQDLIKDQLSRKITKLIAMRREDIISDEELRYQIGVAIYDLGGINATSKGR